MNARSWEGTWTVQGRGERGRRAIAQSPGREAALAWASLAQRFPASSVLAREGAGCGSVGPQPLSSLRRAGNRASRPGHRAQSSLSAGALRYRAWAQSWMPSNHLILCRPLLLLPSIFPSIWVFSNESVLRIRWPKYWSFTERRRSELRATGRLPRQPAARGGRGGGGWGRDCEEPRWASGREPPQPCEWNRTLASLQAGPLDAGINPKQYFMRNLPPP